MPILIMPAMVGKRYVVPFDRKKPYLLFSTGCMSAPVCASEYPSLRKRPLDNEEILPLTYYYEPGIQSVR